MPVILLPWDVACKPLAVLQRVCPSPRLVTVGMPYACRQPLHRFPSLPCSFMWAWLLLWFMLAKCDQPGYRTDAQSLLTSCLSVHIEVHICQVRLPPGMCLKQKTCNLEAESVLIGCSYITSMPCTVLQQDLGSGVRLVSHDALLMQSYTYRSMVQLRRNLAGADVHQL